MATNKYINNYQAANEQDLIDKLTIEAIQMKGLDVCYIPRSQPDIDYLFNEDPSAVYDAYTKIEMLPLFVDGFEGMGEMIGLVGSELSSTGTFGVSKTRFAAEFPEFVRPREGDLIFMPVTNAILEIKFVDDQSPFFEKGKQYVFQIKVETFEFSHESIADGGDVDIDSIIDSLDVPAHDTTTEPYGSNDELDTNTSIDFDPTNPFGVR